MKILGVVLTFNEERHLGRCLASLSQVCHQLLVVDSFSTDRTLEIASTHRAHLVQRAWTNHATQLNWALEQLPPEVDWVLRLDADEYLTPELVDEINQRLTGLPDTVQGVFLRRRMTFQGTLIRHGGVFPVRIMRLFRRGTGKCENRWMDEQVVVGGATTEFTHEFIDDNLNSLTWWTTKHNRYASLEVVDMLNSIYHFMPHDSAARLSGGGQPGLKRWIKERVYWRLPSGLRALLYFGYRYVLRLGFLDGSEGAAFHILQGFWYRYLVDAKMREVKRCMDKEGLDVRTAITRVLEVKLPLAAATQGTNPPPP
jgi:glycosyltransferase involved in cell wall biosynthesis